MQAVSTWCDFPGCLYFSLAEITFLGFSLALELGNKGGTMGSRKLGLRSWFWRSTILVVYGLALTPALVAVGNGEIRHFAITVDGKPAGYYEVTINRRENGSWSIEAQANVNLSYLVYRYRYQLRESELWKDGQLERLESNCNDDGKQFHVSLARERDRLRVIVNGHAHWLHANVWTSTYWSLPDPKLRGQIVTIVDADTGKMLRGTLQFAGTEQVRLGNQVKNCSHYRIAEQGVDLWYDDQERLVREHYVDEGRHVTMTLESQR
jgi:hypothetical protein